MKVTSSVEIKVLGGKVIATHILDDGDTCKLIVENERFETFTVEVGAKNAITEKIEIFTS